MSNDHIQYLSQVELRETVKPIVVFMQQKLQQLYPEQDFTFKEDEFVRDQPDTYELKLTWYCTEAFGHESYLSYMLTCFELIWPENIQRNVLNYTTSLADCVTFRMELLQFLKRHYRLLVAFERLKSYDLRLTW